MYGTLFFALPSGAPAPEDVCAAASRLREGHQAGDHILLVPAHATRAREHLGDLNPVAPLAPLQEDLQVYPRTWVLSLFGAAGELLASSAWSGLEPEQVEVVSGVELVRLRNPAPWQTRARLIDAVETARVEIRRPSGQVVPCDRRRDRTGQGGVGPRLECPVDSDWQYVATEWHRMGDHPRRCLWAHPPNDGELWVHFPGVPLDGELTIWGGHTLHSSRQARAPVELTVVIGDWVERHDYELTDTWRAFRHDLEGLAAELGTRTATVSFGVWSSDPGINHFCFAPDVRAPSRRTQLAGGSRS